MERLRMLGLLALGVASHLWSPYNITAHKRSLGQGNVFTGVCLSTGGRGVGFPVCTQVTWPGGGGSAYGGDGVCIQGSGICIQGRSHPGGGGLPTGGPSASRGIGQTPLPLELGKRAVRILLACFLVHVILSLNSLQWKTDRNKLDSKLMSRLVIQEFWIQNTLWSHQNLSGGKNKFISHSSVLTPKF